MAFAHEGLPKQYRLLRQRVFNAVLRQGTETGDQYFKVFATPNMLPHLRLGLAVSRRVSLKSVTRNRVKRHIRESARRHQRELRGLDVVVIARTAAAATDGAALRASLVQHWSSIIAKCNRSL